jgi:DNA-binding PadR family transcriptional regulator
VHSTLDSLESKRLVSSKQEEPTRVRRGKAKKLLEISHDGEDALREAERSIETLRELVPSTVGLAPTTVNITATASTPTVVVAISFPILIKRFMWSLGAEVITLGF